MLLPALNNARNKARESACLSTQKQMYLMMVNYTEDFKGFFPNPTEGLHYMTRFAKTGSANSGVAVLARQGYTPKFSNDNQWKKYFVCPARDLKAIAAERFTGVSSYMCYFRLSSNSYYKCPVRLSDNPNWLLYGDTHGVTWDWRDNNDKTPANAVNHKRGAYWTTTTGAVKIFELKDLRVYPAKQGGIYNTPRTWIMY